MRPQPLEAPPARAPGFGFAAVRDAVIAPARAYAAVVATRAWAPAYAVVVVASLVYLVLTAPAVSHLATIAPPDHSRPAMTPADATRAYLLNDAIYEIVQPLLMWGLTAMTMTSIARFKGAATPFAAFFALAAVASIPAALGALVDGIAIRLHDPASFVTLRSLAIALPDNLAIFASNANEREAGFLSNFGVFELWSTLVLAFGFVTLGRVRVTTALLVTFALQIVFAFVFSSP